MVNDAEQMLKNCLFIATDYTNRRSVVTDEQMDGHHMTA